MGTRSSKHNRGRKPEYKEHNALEVFEEKRELVDNFVDDETPELGNDLPELQSLTFGGIDPDLQNRVPLISREEIDADIPIAERPEQHKSQRGRAGGRKYKPYEIQKTAQQLRQLASISNGLSAKKRKALREILGDFHWDKVGRVHYLMTLLKASSGYCLPSSFHEQDPLEIMMMAEEMDLEKATAIRLPKLFAKAIA